MICRHCGKEIADGVKFCNYCGKRLGKRICPKCGSEVPEDGLFCGECGASLNAQPAAVKEVAAADAVLAKSVDWKKIVTFIGWGFLAFAALMGLIFTFCIGVSAEIAGIGKTETIYEYFGKAYEECKTVVDGWNEQSEELSAITMTAIYMPTIIGTVLSAGALIGVLVFAIKTTVACVNRFIYKKEQANFEKSAAGLYISFAFFATAFLALNSYSVEYSGVGTSVAYSDATFVGLVLGGIGLGGYFVCKTVLRISDFKEGKNIVKSSIMLGVGVVAIIVAILSAGQVVGINETANKASLGCGYMGLIQLLVYGNNTNEVLIVCCSALGFTAQIILILLTVKTVLSSAKYISEGNGGKILPLAITVVVLSAVNLALSITVGKLYLDGLDESEGSSLGYGAPIAVFVLSVVVLVGVIVAVSLFKANGAQPAEYEKKQVNESEGNIQ